MKINIKFIVTLIITFILFSCNNRVVSLKKDVDVKLQQDEGYLLIEINTNIDLYEIRISGEQYTILTKDDLEQGSNYILVNIPAGDYQISRVKTSRYRYFSFNKDEDEGMWNFTIEPGVISYVGTLSVYSRGWWTGQARFELVNNSSDALRFIERKFPNIYAGRKLKYWGPGKDEFFDFAEQFKNNKGV